VAGGTGPLLRNVAGTSVVRLPTVCASVVTRAWWGGVLLFLAPRWRRWNLPWDGRALRMGTSICDPHAPGGAFNRVRGWPPSHKDVSRRGDLRHAARGQRRILLKTRLPQRLTPQ
jgi:hypothetical protein